MPKTKISEYSTTNSNNTDIQSINIDEGCAPSGINNAIRELMVHLKNWQTNASGDGATFASLVVQGTGSFTGAVTMSAGATLSGTNTLSGSNIMSGNINSSGTNTFSGSQVISGNINSSGSANTFSGTVVMSGANTISYAAGSVSAPAANRNGDTDTGIYFPAANEVAVAAGGSVAAAFNSHQFMGMRNRIINGAMVIDQRNAGASFTPSDGNYTLDRWAFFVSQSSKLTTQQSSVAPAGFTNSLLVTSSSAYSSGTNDYFVVQQTIEGYNVADMGFGAAGAATFTLSFWVRSSLTGTFGGSAKNLATNANRSYPFTYTINSANTWEQKTVTIAGDTTGTWDKTTGSGLCIDFNLGTGTTYSGTAGAWAGTNYLSATGAVSVVGTNGATWYITGVQLEVGSVATPFERRDYGRELIMCQRYFYLLGKTSTFSSMGVAIGADTTESLYISPLPVTMRAVPSFSTAGNIRIYNGATRAVTSSSINAHATPNIPSTTFIASGGGLAAGQGLNISANNDSTAYIAYSAEL